VCSARLPTGFSIAHRMRSCNGSRENRWINAKSVRACYAGGVAGDDPRGTNGEAPGPAT